MPTLDPRQWPAPARRFVIVGAVNTLLGGLGFRLGLWLLAARPGGVALAQVGATAMAMAVSYALHRHWTFAGGAPGSSRSRRPPARVARFALVQVALLWGGAGLLQAAAAWRLPLGASWVVVTATAALLNYVAQRRWVFPAPAEPRLPPPPSAMRAACSATRRAAGRPADS